MNTQSSNSYSCITPIVLFVYNRPDHTRKTIEALARNELANISDLFIYSDASKTSSEEADVIKVREYLKSINGFRSITIIERKKNWGLADSITDGVTSIVNKYGRVIVLEDDLITSPYFLKFMNGALEFYQNEEKVMHISGYMFPIKTDGLGETFFLKPTSCWGWATWARAWIYFEKKPLELIQVFSQDDIKNFNLNNSNDYWSQITHNLEGKIKTWAIFWYASVFRAGGLSIHPQISYTQNIGHDGSGVHCEANSFFDVPLCQKISSFEKEIVLNEDAERRLEKYFQSIRPSLFQRIFSRIKKIKINFS